MKRFCMLVMLAVIASGCGLLGPSPDEVKKAMEIVERSFMASKGFSPQVHSEYSNSAEITMAAPDGSLVNKMNLLMDSERALFVKGECKFSHYRDEKSGKTINGSVYYKFDSVKQEDPNAAFGEMAYNVTFEGGNIKSLDVAILKNKNGILVNELSANGKKIDLKSWDTALRMIQAINPANVKQQ